MNPESWGGGADGARGSCSGLGGGTGCDDGEDVGTDDRVPAPCAGTDATPTGVGNSFAPHIPQKRLSSEFALPQRGQRTDSPPV